MYNSNGNIAPVMLMFFSRDYTLPQVFNRIKEVKPPVLFLVCDGGRDENEWEKVNACRNIVTDTMINWQCKVFRYYYDKNVGMYRALFQSLRKAFNEVDRFIFLEDDILPSSSFFEFCSYNLERYKNDERIQMICGNNQCETYEVSGKDYFFSKIGSIWGFAIWKRVYETFDYDILNTISEHDEILAEHALYKQAGKIFRKHYQFNKQNKLTDDQRIAFEYINGMNMALNNRLNLISSKNMVTCLGVGKGTAHSTTNVKKLCKKIQKLFYMKAYDYEFPLKDNDIVINDINYVSKVENIMGWSNCIQPIVRRIEALARRMMYR